jgi:TetR/AcrR family transcriptional regulator, transcriptional repressor for nem operon
MRYAPDHKDRSRARILSSASRLLRRDGIDGMSVAAAMKDAGLTHGSFYAHFDSKDELVAESIRFAVDETIGHMRAAVASPGNVSPLHAIINWYLSEGHLKKPWAGCAAALIGQQAVRSSATVKSAMAERVGMLIEFIATYTPGENEKSRRVLAQAICSTMLGGVVIASMYEEKAQREAILASARDGVWAMVADHERF